VRVRRLPAGRRVSGQPLTTRLFGAFDISEYNLIHFHAPNPLASVALLAEMTRRPSPPLVITHHMDMRPGGPLRWAARAAYGRLLAAARTVMVSSKKNAAISGDLRPGLNYAAVPFGVVADDYRLSAPQRRDAREWRRSLVGDAWTIGFVGRHARYKGLDVLVKALAMTPGVHALIGGDGPYRAPSEALARSLGVAERTHFLGEISEAEKLRLFAASDAFVMPSTEITEAFGIAQLEAMAAGLPVIASDLPTGVTDVTVHGVSGLLCAPGDSAALSAAMRRLADHPALRDQLAAGAQAHVRQRFEEEIVLARAVETLEAALVGARSRGQAASSSETGARRVQQVAEHA
jgi:glycosyltransferase involved in cell wall biosynthesis